jgi:hypothetical protein
MHAGESPVIQREISLIQGFRTTASWVPRRLGGGARTPMSQRTVFTQRLTECPEGSGRHALLASEHLGQLARPGGTDEIELPHFPVEEQRLAEKKQTPVPALQGTDARRSSRTGGQPRGERSFSCQRTARLSSAVHHGGPFSRDGQDSPRPRGSCPSGREIGLSAVTRPAGGPGKTNVLLKRRVYPGIFQMSGPSVKPLWGHSGALWTLSGRHSSQGMALSPSIGSHSPQGVAHSSDMIPVARRMQSLERAGRPVPSLCRAVPPEGWGLEGPAGALPGLRVVRGAGRPVPPGFGRLRTRGTCPGEGGKTGAEGGSSSPGRGTTPPNWGAAARERGRTSPGRGRAPQEREAVAEGWGAAARERGTTSPKRGRVPQEREAVAEGWGASPQKRGAVPPGWEVVAQGRGELPLERERAAEGWEDAPLARGTVPLSREASPRGRGTAAPFGRASPHPFASPYRCFGPARRTFASPQMMLPLTGSGTVKTRRCSTSRSLTTVWNRA